MHEFDWHENDPVGVALKLIKLGEFWWYINMVKCNLDKSPPPPPLSLPTPFLTEEVPITNLAEALDNIPRPRWRS